jgi:hypothetical protein
VIDRDDKDFNALRFVAFYSARLVKAPEETTAAFQKLVHDRKKRVFSFGIGSPEFRVAVLRVMTFICRFLHEQPEGFDVLMADAFDDIDPDASLPLKHDACLFIEAFAQATEFTSVRLNQILSVPTYSPFIPGLLKKVALRSAEVIRIAVTAWLKMLQLNPDLSGKSDSIANAIFEYWGEGSAIENVLSVVLANFQPSLLDFCEKIAAAANVFHDNYQVENPKALFAIAPHLLAPDHKGRISASNYFWDLFHLPRGNDDDLLGTIAKTSSPSDILAQFSDLFDKLFGHSGTVAFQEFSFALLRDINRLKPKDLEMFHLLILESAFRFQLNCDSPGFVDFVKIILEPPLLPAAVRAITVLVDRQPSEFVIFCLSNSISGLGQTVVERIGTTSDSAIKLINEYIEIITGEEDSFVRDTSYSFYSTLVTCSGRIDASPSHIASLLFVSLLLIAHQYLNTKRDTSGRLPILIQTLTESPNVISLAYGSQADFAETIRQFSECIVTAPAEELHFFVRLCHTHIDTQNLKWSAPVIASLLIQIAFSLSRFENTAGLDIAELWGTVSIAFTAMTADQAVMIANIFVRVPFPHAIPEQKGNAIVGGILRNIESVEPTLRQDLFEVASLLLPATTLDDEQLGVFAGLLRDSVASISLSPAMVKALRYLVKKQIEFLGGDLSHIRLLKDLAHVDGLNIEKLYLKMFQKETFVEALGSLADSLGEGDMNEICTELLVGADLETITPKWISVLRDIAFQVSTNRDEFTDFFEIFYSLCAQVSVKRGHPCQESAILAIGAII